MSSTITVNPTFAEVSSQVCSISYNQTMNTASDTNIDVSSPVRLFQVIITNQATTILTTLFLKIWNVNSAPTVSASAWTVPPDYVLPFENAATTDFTFTGDDQFQFDQGMYIAISQNGGGFGDTAVSLQNIDITIFVKS